MAHRRILSFKYAFEGIWQAFREEPNLKFHFLAGLIVVFMGLYFHITRSEWIVLAITIGVVISVELTNTAIESVVDSFVSSIHPGAKKAKDISAGAVLVISVTSLSVGLMVFWPYIKAFLRI